MQDHAPDLPSISAFFPCYNDAQTIASMVLATGETLQALTDDFEVIVINDGSTDGSAAVLAELQQRCDYLRVVSHEGNRGYGGALQSGFAAASKELVFYTDGDAQYDPREVIQLLAELTPEVDVIQGWKVERHDPLYRKILGGAYCEFVRLAFGLRTRDVDCDFRLMRRQVLQSFPLTKTCGSITVELVARIEYGGFRVQEVPVHHYPRLYGKSQFFSFRRVARTLWHIGLLWFDLHLGLEPAPPATAPAISAPLR
ncbi:MAG TPA: glycosyltransferase family 2 protein [Chloroflexota bacterium]|nr:glycosyltransferase family 2 protein [Chloroflexota bacterium]